MNKVVKELIKTQFREYWRAPEVLFWTLGFPIMIASILGMLYSFKPPVNYKAALIEYEAPGALKNGITAPEKIHDILLPGKPGSNERKISFQKMKRADAEKAYQSGMVEIIVQEMADGSLQFYFDPANERAENLYLWINNDLHGKRSGKTPVIVALDQKGSRYIDYLIPGLIALGIMNSTLWGIGWTLIEFRIKKFLRRMIVTPMRKIDFLLSIFIVRLILSIVEVSVLYTFAHYTFGVTLEGSLGVLILLFMAGHTAFGGLSILVASRTSNTRVGNGLINIITMPMFLLSGVFFSYHSFPQWMVSIIQYLPLTVLADSMRNVFLFNADLAGAAFSIIYLFTFGIIFYIAGLKIYRWY